MHKAIRGPRGARSTVPSSPGFAPASLADLAARPEPQFVETKAGTPHPSASGPNPRAHRSGMCMTTFAHRESRSAGEACMPPLGNGVECGNGRAIPAVDNTRRRFGQGWRCVACSTRFDRSLPGLELPILPSSRSVQSLRARIMRHNGRDRIARNGGIEDDRGPPGPVSGTILEGHGPVACNRNRHCGISRDGTRPIQGFSRVPHRNSATDRTPDSSFRPVRRQDPPGVPESGRGPLRRGTHRPGRSPRPG